VSSTPRTSTTGQTPAAPDGTSVSRGEPLEGFRPRAVRLPQDLEGEQSPWKKRVSHRPATVARLPDSLAEQRLEAGCHLRTYGCVEVCASGFEPIHGQGDGGTSMEAAVVVTRYGCWRGHLRGVRASRESGGPPSVADGNVLRSRRPARKRGEPWSAAGCNTLAPSFIEQAPDSIRGCARSKPPRWCETTRAERVSRSPWLALGADAAVG